MKDVKVTLVIRHKEVQIQFSGGPGAAFMNPVVTRQAKFDQSEFSRIEASTSSFRTDEFEAIEWHAHMHMEMLVYSRMLQMVPLTLENYPYVRLVDGQLEIPETARLRQWHLDNWKGAIKAYAFKRWAGHELSDEQLENYRDAHDRVAILDKEWLDWFYEENRPKNTDE